MKRILFTIILVTTLIGSINGTNFVTCIEKIPSHIISNLVEDNEWILIGEVTLSNYYNSSETIKANLYVREVANNLIYRVEYQGSYYATRWHDDSNTYHVTINGITYRCDVPALSNGNTANNQSLNKFVGIWKSTEKGPRDFGDIQISNKDGKFLVQIKKPYGLQSKTAKVSNDCIEWSIDVNVEYGKWSVGIYDIHFGEVIVGDGYSYMDRRKPKGGGLSSRPANKEVLREYYKARIIDGNLNISISYEYLYYDDNTYCFSCDGDYTINNLIYTQW